MTLNQISMQPPSTAPAVTPAAEHVPGLAHAARVMLTVRTGRDAWIG